MAISYRIVQTFNEYFIYPSQSNGIKKKLMEFIYVNTFWYGLIKRNQCVCVCTGTSEVFALLCDVNVVDKG